MTQRHLTQINPHMWLNEIVLPEYSVRGALLIGTQRAVIWDTLSHPDDMLNLMSLLGQQPLDVVYSHADWDHIWGTGGLPHEQARIIGQTHCLERFSLDVPGMLEEMSSTEPRYKAVQLIPPTLTFDQSYTIDLGGLTLNISHLPGHTPDSTVAFVPEYGILLAGDTVETPFPVMCPDSPLATWITGLQSWADHDRVKSVIPAHGPIGTRNLLRNNISYLQAIVDGTPLDQSQVTDPFYLETDKGNRKWRPPARKS